MTSSQCLYRCIIFPCIVMGFAQIYHDRVTTNITLIYGTCSIVCLDGIIILSLMIESKAFIPPGIGIVWIQSNSFIIGFDGLVVLALVSESDPLMTQYLGSVEFSFIASS